MMSRQCSRRVVVVRGWSRVVRFHRVSSQLLLMLVVVVGWILVLFSSGGGEGSTNGADQLYVVPMLLMLSVRVSVMMVVGIVAAGRR